MPKSFLIVLLIISIFLNLIQFASKGKNSAVDFAEKRDSYPYLARRILIDHPNEVIINFVDLRTQIANYAKKIDNQIGIYFQYLPTGIAVAHNGDTPFVSASLLKVPTVMKVYKMIEEGEVKKEDTLVLTKEVIDSKYGDLWERGEGAKVTVEEAIRLSLTSSDNTAHKLLYVLSKGRPTDVYSYLDIPVNDVGGETAVTPRSYSSILRNLFYSAYLSLKDSNEILELMTESIEGDLLRSTVPEDVKISQKFGVYELGTDPNKNVYSHCGIVYIPDRPYTLCVMVVGNKETADRETREVSDLVYKYIDDID